MFVFCRLVYLGGCYFLFVCLSCLIGCVCVVCVCVCVCVCSCAANICRSSTEVNKGKTDTGKKM